MNDWGSNLQATFLPSCSKLLENLAVLASKGGEKLPLVRLYFATGLTAEGYVLKLEFNKSHHTLAFYQSHPYPSLTYFDIQHISGVGFKDIRELDDEICKQVLGFSKISEVAPISKLALRRLVEEKNQTLKSAIGISIELLALPDLPDELGLCKKYLLEVLEVLEEIWEDQLGKQAVKEKLKSLSFDFSREANHFTIKEQTLSLEIALNKFPKKAVFKRVIEDLL